MATAESILKAQALGTALKAITGIEPQYRAYENYVSIYYPQNVLPQIQDKIDQVTKKTGEQSDVRFEWIPVVAPIAIKKILPIAIGLIAGGYILGKLT